MLSDKVVIVQASKDSGALYTATCGLKYNKEVYAVPGTIYDKYNEGTNILIYNGANIYLSPDNILTGFNYAKIENKQNNYTGLDGIILSLINKEEALKRLKYYKPNNQICIVNQEIIDKYLSYEESKVV